MAGGSVFMKKWKEPYPSKETGEMAAVKRKRGVARGRSRVRTRSSTKRARYAAPNPYKSGTRMKIGSSVSPKPSRNNAMVVYRPRYRRNYKQNGSFGGKFKKLTRRSGRALDRFYRLGVSLTEEVTGSGDDANCVYTMAECMSAYRVIQLSIAAVIKKLFMKAGFSVTGWDDNPWVQLSGSASMAAADGDYHLILVEHDMTAGTFSNVVDASSASYPTFRQCVEVFVSHIEHWCAGFGVNDADNDHLPYAFVLIKNARNVADSAATFIKLAEVVLDQCVLDLKGSLSFKIQNRTVSATGGTESDDVSAAPIQGRMYEFKGTPRVKSVASQGVGSTFGTYKFSQFYTANNGVEVFNPSNLDPAFKEPPPPANFWNCRKSSEVRLEPGQIKSYGLTDYKNRIPIIRLWRSIHYQTTDSGTADFYTYNVYKLLMFGFEDVINVNGSALVTIVFEAERKLSILCSEKRNTFTKVDFIQTSVTEN